MTTGSPRPFTLTLNLSADEYTTLEAAARAKGQALDAYVVSRGLAAAKRDDDQSIEHHIRTYRWMRCDRCNALNFDPNGDLTLISKPAPCCGATGTRIMWPSTGASNLAAVARLDLDDPQDVHAATLFLAAACEAFMEETLWNAYAQLAVTRSVAEALDASAQGRQRQIGLYSRLVGSSPKAVLDKKGQGPWFAAWGQLVDARNDLAHGDLNAVRFNVATLRGLVETVRDGAIDAFAELHNAAIASATRQRATP